MDIIWTMKEALIREVLAALPSPRPPYTTLASHFRQLEKKGFLDHREFGNTFQYFPKVTRETYRQKSTRRLINQHFEGSTKNFLSFLVKEENLTNEELNELKKLINEAAKKQKP